MRFVAFTDLAIAFSSFVMGARSLKQYLGSLEEKRGRSDSRRPVGDLQDRLPKMTSTHHRVYSLKERVRYIQKMTQKSLRTPKVRSLAVAIVSRKCGRKFCIDERDYANEVKAIFDYVRSNIRYVRDPQGIDTFTRADRTFDVGGGDCDDYAIVLASLLGSVGYPTRFRVIRTKGASDWNHIYVMVGIPPRDPQEWVPLDASVNRKMGWEAPAAMVAARKDFEAT